MLQKLLKLETGTVPVVFPREPGMARHDYKSFSARLDSRAGKVRDVATQDLSLVCCLAANFSASC